VGRLEPDITERGALGDLFAVFERLAKRLAPDVRAPAAAVREARPPLGAFEHYIKGLIAESPAAQATFLETAIRQHAGYERAQLALWEVRTEQGDDVAALAAARAVGRSSPHAERARFLAGVSLLELERHGEAFDTFKALVADGASPAGAQPSGAVFNNLGVLQIRRGGSPQTGTAAYYFTKAVDAAPADVDYLFNLGYAYAIDRQTQGAVYWLREAVRRNPADADAHYVLAATLQSSGSTVEAAREIELARQLASRYEESDRRPAGAEALTVPKGLERVRTDLDPVRTVGSEQAIVSSAQRDQRDLAGFHLDHGRRLYDREEDREALAELRRAVYLSPYEAQAHLLIGRIYLRAGTPEAAVDALKISVWSADTASARIALGEAYLKLQNATAARRELERALVLDPASAEAKRLLASIK
jgi:tetratricopeptide (TPR) repeat protein